VKATILLCDSALVAEGKLFILGGGWSLTGPGLAPMAIALKLDVAWGETQDMHHWELYLVDQDGNSVVFDTPEGPQPVEVRGDFQVGSPQGVPPGADVPVNIAVNLGPLPLPPNGRYTWRLSVDGETNESWEASFSTRPSEEGQPQGIL
jgi:hypothetical protein